jgi:hypothetical protein
MADVDTALAHLYQWLEVVGILKKEKSPDAQIDADTLRMSTTRAFCVQSFAVRFHGSQQP